MKCSVFKMKKFLWIILILCGTQWAESAKILGVIPSPGYSHYYLGKRLMETLVERGHDVTVISAFNEKDAKFKTIHMSGVLEDMEEMKKHFNLFEYSEQFKISQIMFVHSMGLGFVQKTFDHPNFKKLLASDETYDLIIMEQFFMDGFRGLCHHYKAPCVLLSSIETYYWTNMPTGNPENPSYMPAMELSHFGPMNFCQRLENTFLLAFSHFYSYNFGLSNQDAVMRAVFPKAPPLKELVYEPALFLINSHVSTAAAVPHVPTMVEIGGFHVKPPKKLPDDLQKYMDSAKEGVILFSMGSALDSKSFPIEMRKAFLEAFSKLKVKVLWKFEEDLPGKPANVKIAKWLPQNDILAHPNIKLFITHGGLLSTIEAIYHGIPIIGIPMFGDQQTNMATSVSNGFAVSLNYKSLTENSMTAALNEVLNNNKYDENAKRLSKIMHDRPLKPLDTAMYWIEYAIRHKGVQHLRSAALDLYWYQILCLDVIATLGFISLAVIYIITLIFRKLCCKKSIVDKSVKREKKNK